ncbi:MULTISPECIES: dTDP-4-dehydrorhamnose 3,5-epimerase [Sutcliffiella]|uniref:dTDP-4-dehydrorhamnose 3,5-epimerase n=1 Tax=Sutcliffiella cohnii TaxID=33932 RepID=A0A223KML7_9BACI|nr:MULTISPECIES: dTDP-4-dehydrorhamnose 3,5-epimerase [Sutcliffiella]AST90646.1 dTDP-4-dehydrorhamnose 3,5-epimerase [Sutcliffiella cohnii]MED4016934.1 dTDP-4-dehydrorhamnose 3,5-epimerase [Sutcliffiella cohnii]WBL16298.1 dTDP-4-dehydrorhamnose 3,5-epimerase [Sutcliffiella sp. NC1]
MNVKSNPKFNGVFEIVTQPIMDNRGCFYRCYDEQLLEKYRIKNRWVQENHAYTKKEGVIRGFHFQFPPYSEAKMVRVISGEIYDVFIDLRKDSPTFGKWGGVKLSKSNQKILLIPKGFAHAYCTLKPNTEVVYKVDAPYNPESEGGIRWDDRFLKVDWPIKNPILSEKDKKLDTFQSFVEKHNYLNV